MTWPLTVDREELEKQARHAMSGLESFRRFVEGDPPYRADNAWLSTVAVLQSREVAEAKLRQAAGR